MPQITQIRHLFILLALLAASACSPQPPRPTTASGATATQEPATPGPQSTRTPEPSAFIPSSTQSPEIQATSTVARMSPTPSPTAAASNCSQPVELAAAGDTIAYRGVQFRVAPSLDMNFTVQECEAGLEYGDWGRNFPAHLYFKANSPLPNNSIQPEIRVFEIAEDMRFYSYPLNTLHELQRILRRRLEPSPWYSVVDLHARDKYLDFQGGSGVRGIVAYFQDLFFWNNNSLRYTFNALSDDGRTFISVDFPLNAPFLMDLEGQDPRTNTNPQAIPITGWPESFEERLEVVQEYNLEAFRRLEAAAPADFTPDLSLYDDLVQSLEVGNPE